MWGGVGCMRASWQRLATCSTLGTRISCHYLGVSNEYPLFSLCCNRASLYKTWNDAAECFNPPHTPVEEPGRRSLGKLNTREHVCRFVAYSYLFCRFRALTSMLKTLNKQGGSKDSPTKTDFHHCVARVASRSLRTIPHQNKSFAVRASSIAAAPRKASFETPKSCSN